MLKALLYAYILGGLTFIPLLIGAFIFVAIYTSVPVGDTDVTKRKKHRLEAEGAEERTAPEEEKLAPPEVDTNDAPKTRKGWLTVRRTFEEQPGDTGYVTLVRSLLDARSKDPKRSKPKDMWYVVLKGKVLYLYEDEEMSECEAAIELSGHDVVIFPEGLQDGELFAKRNAICLKPKVPPEAMPSVTQEMKLEGESVEEKLDQSGSSGKKREKEREQLVESEKKMDAAREEALDPTTPWFIFVRSNIEMEDWYFALVHASDHPTQTPTLVPLRKVFDPSHMHHLVSTLDEQPDVIPMRWLNALLGRIFFSYYRTQHLESYIIGRLMKKLSKVKRPTFLTDIVVTEVSVGDKAPMFSKPMLKELTKEGDASLEVHLQYKGEVRITVEATATINLGARFKSYTVKLVLAAVLKELEGNLLIKVKRPPSNRIWYAFTQTPRMVLEVEPIVSDRQITWNMILSTIESKFQEIIQESVVMPNMDDIAFFESIPYQRRGGIWSDASRKQSQAPSTDGETSEKEQSVKSSVPDITTTSPPLAPGEILPTLPTYSHSDGDLLSSPPSSPPPAQINRVSSAAPTLDESPDSKNSSRRRTWFSNVRSEDLSTFSFGGDSQANTSADEDDRRGRTAEADRSSSSRSQSTRSKAESVHSSATDSSAAEDGEARSQNSLSPQVSRRSASQHSVKREEDAIDVDSLSNGRPLSTPSTPRKVSDASPASIGRASSPTSFFSTLKSKAGDKQAISNTAKEAIRKWGVNWGGLKRDSTGGSSDDGSDVGSISSRLRAGADSIGTSIQNQRASYMEVRAAVAERKEREERERQAAQAEETSEAPRATSPIPSSNAPNGDGAIGVTHGPSISQSNGSSQSAEGSMPAAPAAPRLSAPSLSSKRSTPSIRADLNAEDLSTSDKPVHSPIHVQPQAKTMTIPGIHASHRGEVMSMGYRAPQPPPPASESKLKNPAIQTVYRLWKSPVLSAAGEEQGTPPATQTQQDTHLETVAKDKDITPLTLSPNSQQASPQPSSSSRPNPPPLPPRSTPIAISRTTLDNSQAPASVSPPSSAADALKSIASKDSDARTQASLDLAQSQSPTSRRSSVRVVNTTDSGDDAISGSSSDQAPASTTPTPTQLAPPPPLPPRRSTQTSS